MGGSDKRLVQRAARGDQRAFEEIYRRYGPDLYRFCLAMTGNRQDAQDALQNAMVKVLRALPGERRQIALKPWLYRIARNETLEVLRKRQGGDELVLEQTAASSVAEAVEVREHLRTLLSDLEQLPQRQRAMLLMRELAGLGFAEIAAAFGTSAAVARQTLYEARLSLRQLEEGRERRCTDVRRELSDADGRVFRRRKTRAHLRDCRDCRAFYEEVVKRQGDLAAIAALPLAASVGMVPGMLGGQAGGAGGGGFGTAVGAAACKAVATSAVVKSAATVAAVAVAVSAADRGGVVDLPRDGGAEVTVQRAPAARVASTEPTGPSVEGNDFGGADTPKDPIVSPRVGSGDQSQVSPETHPATPAKQPAAQELGQGDSETTAMSGVDTSESTDSGGSPGSRPEDPSDPAAEQSGATEDLPESSPPGQQTAAARKPPQAASPPGHEPAAANPGKPAKTDKPSKADSPPPGKPEAPPGRPEGPPGHSEAPPGHPEGPPGHFEGPPGHSGKAGPGHPSPGHS